MPKQGASCPDTALPVGYVRTFLPFTLSLYMCLSPTPLAGCPFSKLPQSRGLCVCVCVGVEVCVSACLDTFMPLFNSSPAKRIYIFMLQQTPTTYVGAICWCVMRRRSQIPGMAALLTEQLT